MREAIFLLLLSLAPLFANCIENQPAQGFVMKNMKENALVDYSIERESLNIDQIHLILDQGIELGVTQMR